MRSYSRAPAFWFGLIILCLCSSHAFAAAYTLTIQVEGPGTVSRNPTNNVYPEGVVVTITATPASGWSFAGWSGDASGVANPLNVMMNTDKVITAKFSAIPSFTLSVTASGQGAVSLDPPGGTYLSNSVVSVSATPASGWVFAQWTGAESGNANPLSVNLSADKSITAVFAELPVIDSQPQNVSANIGDTVSFAVHATGTAPLSYQWFLNGAPLAGASASMLTLTNVQPAQAGGYSAVVSNAYGVASSVTARLTLANACMGTNVVSVCTEANLRAAIAAGGVVSLCCNGTITLTNTIDIIRDVALDAQGRNVVISGGDTVRLFQVSPGVRFAVTNLTLANGRHVGLRGTNGLNQSPPVGYPSGPGLPGQGGAIFNDGGMVELAFTTLTNNRAIGGTGGTSGAEGGVGGVGAGGAVFSQNGALLLYAVNMSSNVASGGSGGFVQGAMPRGGDGLGGAIYATNSQVMVLNSVLSSNTCTTVAGSFVDGNNSNASSAARGGALFHASGLLSISNCTLAANQVAGGNAPTFFGIIERPGSAYGGAIAASGGTVRIERSQLILNTARGGNAFRWSGTGEAQGGAVFSEANAILLASDSSFAGNQALSGSYSSANTDGRGGAIHNAGAAVLDACSIYSNLAKGGDAGGFASPLVNYPGGHALGGGVFNAGLLAATNCTVALNSATGGAGGFPSGIPGSGVGGGIHNDTNGSLTAMNVTVASNRVAAGRGWSFQGTAAGANVANQTNGTLALRNSLIAHGGTNGNAWGVITDGGFNISSDGSANFNSGSSFNFTDPRIGPLANYGGPSLTMALQPNSPAIDFGGTDGAPSLDQRGLSRPFGAGMDIGAYEFHLNQTDLPQLSIASVPNAVILTFEAIPGTEYHLQASNTLSPPWSELELIGPFANPTPVTRTISSAGNSPRFFRLAIYW